MGKEEPMEEVRDPSTESSYSPGQGRCNVSLAESALGKPSVTVSLFPPAHGCHL